VQGVGYLAIALATAGFILPSVVAADFPGCAHAGPVAAHVATVARSADTASATVRPFRIVAAILSDTATADVSAHHAAARTEPAAPVATVRVGSVTARIQGHGASAHVSAHVAVVGIVRRDVAAAGIVPGAFITVKVERC
jgi:hypothetical protein